MRWYKFSQSDSFRNDGGWGRFEHYGTWDVVIETEAGDPTPEEENAIMTLGYYGRPITEKTIQGLMNGDYYDESLISDTGLAIQMDLIDGSDVKSFSSPEEMKEYIEARLEGEFPVSDTGFSTEMGSYELIGTTMSELGIDSNKRKTREDHLNDSADESHRPESYFSNEKFWGE